MLEYRIRRLPAAIERLDSLAAEARLGIGGEGGDVTPRSARDRAGRVVRIRTGELEEHIVADVAWAAACYLVDGDEAFASGPGAS